MKCAASDELTTSTAWMLEEYSCPMRWNTRSAPVRSTRTAIPGYFASKAFASFSATGRVRRGVVDHLAFLLGRIDQRRCDRLGRWCARHHAGRECAACKQRACALEHVTTRDF